MYYDDDEDDDPYAPRTGPAAMPSPRSKYAPYYSGYANTFEDFLEDFEGRAYDCALTDPQRVDTLVRYVDPTLRELCRTFDGFRSPNWSLFRQSLVNVFGNPTPRHQIMRQKLRSYVQDSSRTRMYCEDDVLQYYRQFIRFGLPLVHAGHLSEEERDAAFLYGFHPLDREVLRPRLLGKHPLQPLDIPFHFEDVFGCARAAFAYDDYFPSPWSHAKQFEPSSVRREQLVVEPILRDAYSFREVTRVVASNAETTTIPDELPSISPSPYSSPDTQLPSLSSPSASESQQTQAPSVTLDQPEPAYTLSTTLLPSAYFPTPSHTSSLAHSAADEVPEILSTFPSPSITPVPFSMPMSDFEYLPSATVDQPAPTLSSTPPSASSISSMFLPSPARLATEDLPEPESASTPPIRPSSPILLSGPSLPSPSTDDVPEIASTPPSSSSVSLTNLECVPSEMVDKPEFEPEHASLCSISPTSPPPPAPSLALEFADDVPELSSSLPTSQSSSLASSTPPLPSGQSFESLPFELRALAQSSACELEFFPYSSSAVDFAPPSSESPEFSQSLSSLGEAFPFLPASPEAPPIAHISPRSTPPQRPPELKTVGSDSSPLEIAPVPANLAPSPSTFRVVFSASSDLSSASPPSSLVLGNLELEFFPTPSSAVEIVPQSSPELSESESSLYEVIPFLPAPLDISITTPIPRHSTTSQRPPRLGYRHSPLSRSGLARFNFALSFITVAALVSTLLNVSTLSTHTHKYRSRQQDIGDNRIGNLKTSNSRNIPAHRLRLGQYTPRASRFVFDPGGPASSSRLFGT
ncbi:hypothetical protein EDB85DRAFT_2141003 [Lactarius pseudohatsudake]|nr:hypothetical protein EDB85DRAFT_2141003 [Lactarius pseudohatsudake]